MIEADRLVHAQVQGIEEQDEHIDRAMRPKLLDSIQARTILVHS